MFQVRGNIGSFFRPRFFDLRVVRYSKLPGTGTESYDAAFNYRVNNELNFRGQLHSFGKYLKRNQDLLYFSCNLIFPSRKFLLFFMEKVINHYSGIGLYGNLSDGKRKREKKGKREGWMRKEKKKNDLYLDINVYIINYKISQRLIFRNKHSKAINSL